MFAYCGNNPVVRKDIAGRKWTYTVEESETEVLDERESGTVYQTTMVIFGVETNWLEIALYATYRFEITFTYTVSDDGAIAFDNHQEYIVYVDQKSIRDRLAEEMYNMCTKTIQGSLSNRTTAGISSELYWHYAFYRKEILLDSTQTANIGGRKKNQPGFDSNAWLFELLKSKRRK